MGDNNDASRRKEEFDALQSIYGEDLEVKGDSASPPENGPWRIRIGRRVVLELFLPPDYPSKNAPSALIHAPALSDSRIHELVNEMKELWSEDTECAILWAEHLRAAISCCCDDDDDDNDDNNGCEGQNNDYPLEEENAKESETKETKTVENEGTQTFHPYTAKYGQPIRQFDIAVIRNDSNRRDIHRGKPFHPPKSGPAEIMIAHVASVESMDHVNWVLAELLLNDKKVAKATHNMIAYRFWDRKRGCMVSDNDDDGEKGAGSKLAALLEMSNAQNVIVVVSRWFGGVKLGSSRFKHIASTAREALDEAGFLEDKK